MVNDDVAAPLTVVDALDAACEGDDADATRDCSKTTSDLTL